MGRKTKGSHKVTGIIICINNVKVRIPLDSEEKLQSKEKSIILVKHLSKEFKKFKERNIKTNLPLVPNSQFIAMGNKNSREKSTILPNNNNLTYNNQNNVFTKKNNYNLIMTSGKENSDQNVKNVLSVYNINDKKSETTNSSYQNLLNDYNDPPSNDSQLNYYNYSSSSNNNLHQYDFSYDDEAEKIIAEWDRLWGDGSNDNDTNQLMERDFNLTNMLSVC